MPPPRVPTAARNALIAAALAVLALTGAVAGYRLYVKDRAETAAELVRIRAYLEATAKAELAAADKPVEKLVVARALPAVEPAVEASPPPRANAGRSAPKRAVPPPAARTPPVKAHAAARPPAKLAKAPARPPWARHDGYSFKSVDQMFRDRSARECADGFLGSICREFLKSCLCREHEAWGKASICPGPKPVPQAWPGSVG